MSGCILCSVVVISENQLFDHGWWSACCPDEIGDAMHQATKTFMFGLRDTEDPEVMEIRSEVVARLMMLWSDIKEDPEDDIKMGFPRLGVRPGIDLESCNGTLYVILMK